MRENKQRKARVETSKVSKKREREFAEFPEPAGVRNKFARERARRHMRTASQHGRHTASPRGLLFFPTRAARHDKRAAWSARAARKKGRARSREKDEGAR